MPPHVAAPLLQDHGPAPDLPLLMGPAAAAPALPLPIDPPAPVPAFMHPAPALPLPIVPPAPVHVPPPAPAPAPLPLLPLACQPFNPEWPVHYMKKMDVICPYCQAWHWKCEKLYNSSPNNPKFGKCCLSGKIKIPKLDNPPPELLNLLSSQDDASKKFRDRIRNYNNALAMTSLGCDQDRAINRDGGGPYVFKVQGRLYHQTGPLVPRDGTNPVYAQLYIYDPQEALNYRMNNRANSALDRQIMQTLQDMLYHHYSGVEFYKQAYELTRNMPPEQTCRIALHFECGTDHP